jgi:GntR family transcriptional regulator
MAKTWPLLAVDLESESPIYQQIADGLRRLVARGELEPGEVLPSVRELGDAVGVNLNTVARAYRILAGEGLIELRHGASARLRGRETKAPQPIIDEADKKRLDDLISRCVLRGANKKLLKGVLLQALDDYFEGAKQ